MTTESHVTDVPAPAGVEDREIQMEYAPCPNGCAPADERVLESHDRLHGVPGKFYVVKCRHCQLMRTEPRPAPVSMGEFYPDDYHVYGDIPKRGGTKPQPSLLRKLGKKVVHFNADDLPIEPPGALLEVGCASGHYLASLERLGWDVEGVEFSPTASATARKAGFTVRTGALEEVEDPQRPFDLVVMRMVLEHLHDPVRGLRRLHGWTRPGGWLMASVPDAGAFEMSLFGGAWYALDLPRHLYHFTPDTIGPLLEKGGWRLERVFHQRDVANVVASAGYMLGDTGVLPDLAQKLVRFPQTQSWEKLAFYPLATGLSALGQTGRMSFWARRIDD